MNFHLKDGVYFRRVENDLHIVKARDFDDPGEILVTIDLGSFSSIVASLSPHREGNGSYHYIYEFLTKGTMFCGGCGCRLLPGDYIVGVLSIVNLIACKTCYEQKFKPLFDWGMKQ